MMPYDAVLAGTSCARVGMGGLWQAPELFVPPPFDEQHSLTVATQPGFNMDLTWSRSTGTGAHLALGESVVPVPPQAVLPNRDRVRRLVGEFGIKKTRSARLIGVSQQIYDRLDAPGESVLAVPPNAVLPARDRVRRLVDEFGIRKAHLARLMGVSRQIIYDWLDAPTAALDVANHRRLAWIEDLGARLGEAQREFGSAMSIHLPERNVTVLDLIASSRPGDPGVTDAIDRLRSALLKRAHADVSKVEPGPTASQVSRTIQELSSPVMPSRGE